MSDAMRRRILYVHNGATTFVRRDQRYLAAVHEVVEMPFVPKRKWHTPFLLLILAVRCLFAVPRADAIVCQFAGHHSLFPLFIAWLLGKPSMVLANGSDCVSFPSLGYGHFRKRLLGWSTCMSFKLASIIVPLHASLVRCRPTYHAIDGPEQGILVHCRGLRTPIEPLGYGFDASFWKPMGERRPGRFITVASNAHKSYVQVVKGLDMIIRIAPRFPHCEFIIVGAREGSLPDKPGNVIEVPYVPNDELPAWYGTATYYLQFSVSEGFGNALCEAMLCGCVPIVSDTGAMPEIVGDAGYVVHARDPDAIERTVREALMSDTGGLSMRARERIGTCYPSSLRMDGLLSKVGRLM